MKTAKIKDKFENSNESLFENDRQFENTQFAFADSSAILRAPVPDKTITEKADIIIKVLRYIFLFLPGAFFLYKLPMSFLYFSGQSIIPADAYVWLMLWLAGGSFLTFAGVGNLKEVKNLVVPLYIIGFSMFLGVLLFSFPEPLRGQIYASYSIYLFPLALIIAGLAKIWVNKK